MGRPWWIALVLGCPVAHAEERVHLTHIPDILVLEPAFTLEQTWCGTGHAGFNGSLTVGAGKVDGDPTGIFAIAMGIGARNRDGFVVGRTEFTAAGLALAHGRHQLLADYTMHDRDASACARPESHLTSRSCGYDEPLAVASVEAALEHGPSRPLAPVRLGPGHVADASGAGQATIFFGPEKDDMAIEALVRVEAGATWWNGVPGVAAIAPAGVAVTDSITRATREAVELSLGRAPVDGEIPRGRLDFLRGRVEHQHLIRPLLRGDEGSAAANEATVRRIDLGFAVNDLTFHVDREVLGIVHTEFGWSWLDADNARTRFSDNMFRMQLAGAIAYRGKRDRGLRRLGLAIAREPGHTPIGPSGVMLASDWRVELLADRESTRWVFGARGGVSFVRAIAAGHPFDRFSRYATQLEAYAKLAEGFEVGGYLVASYQGGFAGERLVEPPPAHVGTEAALVIRFKPRGTAAAGW